MKTGLKILVGVAGLAVVGLIGIKVFQKPIAMALIDRQLEQNMGRDVIAEFPKGLHVGLCGSAGPLPNRERRAACVFVIAGDALYIVDSGAGSTGTLGSMGVQPGRVRAIFLTHFHSDHIDGLGELMMNRWVQSSAQAPVPVYGPPGVERVVNGLAEAYALDATYRTAHHGAQVVPPSGAGGSARMFDPGDDPMASKVILEEGGLTVTVFNVSHAPISPAVGYRFDYGGRSVVISGDTVPSPSVLAQAQGVDVLVHEALQNTVIERFEAKAREKGLGRMAKIMHDILDYHTSPEQAAEIAQAAGADYLLLYHIVPPLPAFFDKAFLGDAASRYDGPIKIGTDGFMLSLPESSDEIEARDLL